MNELFLEFLDDSGTIIERWNLDDLDTSKHPTPFDAWSFRVYLKLGESNE